MGKPTRNTTRSEEGWAVHTFTTGGSTTCHTASPQAVELSANMIAEDRHRKTLQAVKRFIAHLTTVAYALLACVFAIISAALAALLLSVPVLLWRIFHGRPEEWPYLVGAVVVIGIVGFFFQLYDEIRGILRGERGILRRDEHHTRRSRRKNRRRRAG